MVGYGRFGGLMVFLLMCLIVNSKGLDKEFATQNVLHNRNGECYWVRGEPKIDPSERFHKVFFRALSKYRWKLICRRLYLVDLQAACGKYILV